MKYNVDIRQAAFELYLRTESYEETSRLLKDQFPGRHAPKRQTIAK